MKRSTHRLWSILFTLVCLGLASFLVLTTLQDNVVFFHTPSEIKSSSPHTSKMLRLGGVVEKGSFKRLGNGLKVEFYVTDFKEHLKVSYEGPLPDLFREGQGVVAEGFLSPSGTFYAYHVLAKHDENYRPPAMDTAKKTSS